MVDLFDEKLVSSSSQAGDDKARAKAKKRRRKAVAAAFQGVASMKERHATGADRVRLSTVKLVASAIAREHASTGRDTGASFEKIALTDKALRALDREAFKATQACCGE